MPPRNSKRSRARSTPNKKAPATPHYKKPRIHPTGGLLMRKATGKINRGVAPTHAKLGKQARNLQGKPRFRKPGRGVIQILNVQLGKDLKSTGGMPPMLARAFRVVVNTPVMHPIAYLPLTRKRPPDFNTISQPVIYLIYHLQLDIGYVGQTVSASTRILNHFVKANEIWRPQHSPTKFPGMQAVATSHVSKISSLPQGVHTAMAATGDPLLCCMCWF